MRNHPDRTPMANLTPVYPLTRIDPASDRFAVWLDTKQLAFKEAAELPPEFRAAMPASYAGHRITAAMDGDTVAGTFRSWEVSLTVPGGSVTAEAVSSVTVRPTHRRRGVLTAMITADLAAAAEREVAAAVLIASEARIYGRFGFGPATEAVTWTVDVPAARLHPAAAGLAGRAHLDVVPGAALRAAGPAVYAAARRPGDIDRSDTYWDIAGGLLPPPHPPASSVVVNVLATDGTGAAVGVLRYTATEAWEDRAARTRVDVQLLHASTPEAEAALWGYLVELDLVATVRAADRSVEDPLPWLLADPRAARQSGRCDFLWTRVLDPVAALATRRYDRPGAVVLEIADDAGYAAGRFALEVDAGGRADCTPTAGAPDVELPVATLSSVWLGGHDLVALGRAGLAVEHRGGGMNRAAAMFRTATPPWSSTWF